MSEIIITLKLKPYLLEFIHSHLIDDILVRGNFVRNVISPFVQRIPKDYNYVPIDPSIPCLSIPVQNFKNVDIRDGKVYVSEKNQRQIEQIFFSYFKTCLLSYFYYNFNSSITIKQIVHNFCIFYNVQEEFVQLDSIIRLLRRLRKKTNINPTSCPLFYDKK